MIEKIDHAAEALDLAALPVAPSELDIEHPDYEPALIGMEDEK